MAEAEGEGGEEVVDGAAWADVGLGTPNDDSAPVRDVAEKGRALVLVAFGGPQDAVLGEVLGFRPGDDAVAGWIQAESGGWGGGFSITEMERW